MNTFTISSELNKNKVFILQKSELEKRLDPFFYVPELLELEKKVLAKKPKKLRDYVVSIASGATPKRAEEEKYYSDKENGVPFLRVQNLSQTGVLSLDKTKYINKETHNGMLKRSQVSEGDLLVKITGVGRMAVASVAPENFEGNINQHVCVIKTKDRKVSETLASFLNSDIGEKLASRRSTGGTRPALDYPALLSIPIIEDERILKIKKELIKQKTLNEQKAKDLLNSIDAYLLNELRINLPKKAENTLKNRIFIRSIKEISGSRFDTRYHRPYYVSFYKKINAEYPLRKIKELSLYLGSGSTPRAGGDAYSNVKEGVPFIRITNLKNNSIDLSKVLYIKREVHNKTLKRTQLNSGDLLLSMAGTIGLTVVVPDFIKEANINQALARIVLQESTNKFYICEVLNSSIGKTQTDRLSRPSVQANINFEEIGALLIPLPPKEKQDEIANHIKSIRDKAQALKNKTKELITNANKEMEKILLG